MKFKIDPRTKLYMILIVSSIVMMSATTPLQWTIRIVVTLLPILLLMAEKRYASAFLFSALYAVALGLTFFFLSEGSTGIIKSLLTGYCGIIAQFLPALITAWYVVRTTRIDEFMSAMEKIHMPDGITVSLAVVMRFFPTLREEYESIRDAMKMRGIMFGGGSPVRMVEYRMIPLLFSCVNIGDELSAAAITRGLGGKVKRTSVVALKLHAVDYLMMIGFTAALTIFVIFKYFR